jgi:H+-transporting ATPase
VLLASGLSVIIDAIKESRRIFQRMNSYAMYRIAETLRVLFFMTLAILFFNFYPVTAVMIVMIALLNDGAILSIAYDNVHYRNKPEAWNMRLVLAISTVLGVIGVVAAFGLFYLGERVFHLDRLHVQTLMYLKLSVAGHLTIFLTRTRGPFWSIRPARILWIAVLGTQTIATLIAVYGLFMAPLGWKWAGFVWAYALAWFLINDRVKLLAYRFLDHAKADVPKREATADQSKPDAKADAPKPDAQADAPKPDAKADQPKPEVKAETKPDAKTDQSKPDAKAEAPKPDAKADAPKPEVKAEAKPDATADQPKPDATADAPKPDATADAPKPDAKADQPKPDAKADAPKPDAQADAAKPDATADALKPDAKADQPKPDAKADAPKPDAQADAAKPEAKADQPKPEVKAEAKPDTTADQPKPEVKADAPKPDATADQPKPEAKDREPSEATPQLVKRVHELYEELGRKDVQTVEDWENEQRKPQIDKSTK